MIHVMHVLTSLGRGGAERVVADLVARTDRTAFRHTVCHLHGPDSLADEIRASGCDVVCLDAPERHGWLSASRKLRPLLKSLRPDVLHTGTFDANIAPRFVSWRPIVPQVSWLVSMDYDPASARAAGWSPVKTFARQCLDAVSARLSGTRFVACSDAVKRSAVERLALSAAHVDIIYNPVDIATVAVESEEVDRERATLGLDENAFVYLTIGRLDAPKGQADILRAFAKVAGRQPKSRLVMIGRGPREQDLARLVDELGLASRVTMMPFAPRVAPFLALADAFLFPSYLEGLPVAVLEAMCAGLPVVASDIEPHLEVIRHGETGLIIPRGSVNDLATAMQTLFDDRSLRQRVGRAARIEAQARFAIDVIVRQWEHLYREVAGRNGAF